MGNFSTSTRTVLFGSYLWAYITGRNIFRTNNRLLYRRFLGSLIGLITTIIVSTIPAVTVDPALLKLDQFLQNKNSLLPAVGLVKYPNWHIVVALSVAKSEYGKHLAGDYNAGEFE